MDRGRHYPRYLTPTSTLEELQREVHELARFTNQNQPRGRIDFKSEHGGRSAFVWIDLVNGGSITAEGKTAWQAFNNAVDKINALVERRLTPEERLAEIHRISA